MKKVFKIMMLSLSILIIFSGCSEECNDCLELTTKNIKYINSSGTNLLFGDQAIFDPDSVIVKAGNNNSLNVWKQEDTETILFNLEGNYTTYFIFLSDSMVDTLDFLLAERKSTNCCGHVTYSMKTILNGSEIENNDLIVITR